MKTGTLRQGASRSDVSQAGRRPAWSLPDAVPKRRRQHRRGCAKYRGSGSATESSRPAAFPEWDWPAAPRRDHGTIGTSDARSTVLETWRKLNRFADPSVGMKHNLSHEVLGIPNRKPFEQFTAARFGLLSR